MNKQLIFFLLMGAAYALMFLICEYLNKKWRINSEYTRKLAHVISLLLALLFPYLFEDAIFAYLLTGTAAILLLVAGWYKKLLSIHGVDRRSGGSYLLAIAVGISFFIYKRFDNSTIYLLPLLILMISDPLANIVGVRIRSNKLIHGKSFAGSVSFFISAFLINIVVLWVAGYDMLIPLSFAIALISTLAELFSSRGIDNLTIPLAVLLVLVSFEKICHATLSMG